VGKNGEKTQIFDNKVNCYNSETIEHRNTQTNRKSRMGFLALIESPGDPRKDDSVDDLE